MTPFCKSKRGGSQERERELVVVRGAVKLDGAPVGTVKVGYNDHQRTRQHSQRIKIHDPMTP